MRKVYIDMTEKNNCISVFVKDAQIIQAGTTIYSMPITDRNAEYQKFAEEYDIHFIFVDVVPNINFYTIPRIDIMAADNKGGFIGTVGEMSNLDSSAPICYISSDRKAFIIAENFRVFLNNISCWKANLKPYYKILFFNSKEDAQKTYEFFKI